VRGTFHYNRGFYYFRNVGDRILLGGGRNLDFRGETTTELAITDQIQQRLESLLREVILPNTQFQIDGRWSGIMAFGEPLEPLISEVRPRVLCAVRCNGMGVALGTLTGSRAARAAVDLT
jgi:glycine/D-amino acid oxidase-like deaminating enzyme